VQRPIGNCADRSTDASLDVFASGSRRSGTSPTAPGPDGTGRRAASRPFFSPF